VTLTDSVNVMLTPQFYTIKREALPVNYMYQAKRIAPSLFEGLLDKAENYEYFIIKEQDTWLFIAYNMEAIKVFLKEKNFALEYISKLYFAEQVVSQFTKPVLLGEKEALVNLNGTAVVVPRGALDEEEGTIKINNQFLPKKGISLAETASLISFKQAISFAIIFILFSVIFIVEGLRYDGNTAEMEEEMRLLLENYPSLQSTYTRESVAVKYKKIDQKERKKREIIKALSLMIFKGATLTSLSIDDKKFNAIFSCENAKIIQKLKELAKREKFNTIKIANENRLRIEGMI